MMKKLQLLSMALLVSVFTMTAQSPEVGPYSDAPSNNNQEALFDFLFGFDIGSSGSTGVDGLAGVAFVNDQYWVSEWASNVIHILGAGGGFVESIDIPGISGTRSMTTDGTSIFIGTAGSSIFEVDPVTKTLTNTISVTSTAAARMCTYDETLDGGNGGFWIGNFSGDIASVDMDGDELSLIPAATHNTVIYGGAFDNVSPGGPFLWIHDQSGTAPARDFITQLDPATGVPTGVSYDYSADATGTEVLAGGLFISADVDTDNYALVGVCQCTPSNELFALELTPLLGVEDNAIANFTISPNPASNGVVSINTTIPGEKQVVVFDVLGKKVLSEVVTDQLNVAALNAGVYLVQVTQNSTTATKKLIIK